MLNNNTLHYTTLHYTTLHNNHTLIHCNNCGYDAAQNIDPCGRFYCHPQGIFVFVII